MFQQYISPDEDQSCSQLCLWTAAHTQNHKILWVGRDLWNSLSSVFLVSSSLPYPLRLGPLNSMNSFLLSMYAESRGGKWLLIPFYIWGLFPFVYIELNNWQSLIIHLVVSLVVQLHKSNTETHTVIPLFFFFQTLTNTALYRNSKSSGEPKW